MLAEFYALIAALLATSAPFAMFQLDFLAIGTIVMVVIHVSVCRWVFLRVRVVRIDFCHCSSSVKLSQ